MLTFLKGFFGNTVISEIGEITEKAIESLEREIIPLPVVEKIVETAKIDPEIGKLIESQIGDLTKIQIETVNKYNADAQEINDVLQLLKSPDDKAVIKSLIKEKKQIVVVEDIYVLKYKKEDFSSDTWAKLFKDAKVIKQLESTDTFELSKNTMSNAYTNYQHSMNKYYNMYESSEIPEEKELLGNIVVTLNKNRDWFGSKTEKGKDIIKKAELLNDYRMPKLENLKTKFNDNYNNLLIAESVLANIDPTIKKVIEVSKKQIAGITKITDTTKQLAQSNEVLSKNILSLENQKNSLTTNIQKLASDKEILNTKVITYEADKVKYSKQLKDLELQNQNIQKNLQLAETNLKSVNDKLASTNDSYNKNVLLLEEQTTKSSDLLKELTSKEENVASLSEELKNRTNIIDNYKNEFLKLENDKQAIELQLSNAKDVIKTKTIDIEQAQKNITDLEGDKTAIELQLSNAQDVIKTKTVSIEQAQKNITDLEDSLKLKIEQQDSVKEKITNFLEGTREFIMSQKILTGASVSSIVVGIGSVIALIVKEVTEHKDTKEAIVKRVYNKTGISKDLLAKLYDKALGITKKDNKPKPKKINKVKPKKVNSVRPKKK